MKHLTVITILFCCLTNACTNMEATKQKILSSDSVSVYRVENAAVEPSAQTEEDTYVCNYKAIDEVVLTNAQQNALIKALSKEKNFERDELKRCPFVPEYALKSSSGLSMVVSTEPCAKVMVQESDTSKPQFADLVEGNDIEALLRKIKPKE